MGFQVPHFPLSVNVYDGANFALPPRLVTPGNLAWGKRVNVPSTGGTGFIGIPLVTGYLLLPATVDVRDQYSATAADGFEIPAGSGRRYQAITCDYVGLGFLNVHKCCVVEKIRPFKTPDT